MTKYRLRSMKQAFAMSVDDLRARLYRSVPRNEQQPDLPPLPPGERPQDPDLDGHDMRFEGYRIETLEQGGEYPDTMPQAIAVTDAEGRQAIYVPLSRNGKVVRTSPLIEALKHAPER
ncbi:hypothetical protein [Bradyrhizobium sp. STM 3557]|uniref:hypothetical protein n=1 Tax=Bradyrhizobium sp. STM 3557 TaxID=578920 RepID=UPI00388D0CF5